MEKIIKTSEYSRFWGNVGLSRDHTALRLHALFLFLFINCTTQVGRRRCWRGLTRISLFYDLPRRYRCSSITDKIMWRPQIRKGIKSTQMHILCNRIEYEPSRACDSKEIVIARWAKCASKKIKMMVVVIPAASHSKKDNCTVVKSFSLMLNHK